MTNSERLREIARSLERMRDHIVRGSLSAAQIGQALGLISRDLERIADDQD